MNPITTYTTNLTDLQGKVLHATLRAQGWEFREVPYARFGATKSKINVVFYESGKLVVQGK
ncbi:MAG: ribonuclease HIII, partial [Verrucomicrobiota bacterium]